MAIHYQRLKRPDTLNGEFKAGKSVRPSRGSTNWRKRTESPASPLQEYRAPKWSCPICFGFASCPAVIAWAFRCRRSLGPTQETELR